MGSETRKEIPTIDLSKCLSEEMTRGSKEWNDLCKRVAEACEELGCFEVIYDQISSQLREEVFSITKELFELPLEIKKRNINPKHYRGFYGLNLNPPYRLFEGLGIEDASNYGSVKAFAQLLISDPNAQLHFCKVFSSMIKGVDELQETIMNLIMDSYGVKESNISNESLVRVTRYVSAPGDDVMAKHLGLIAHTDNSLSALICEHQAHGLQIQTKKDGQWIQWFPSPNSFMFIVGDALMAWSNGRMHAVRHRVVIEGEKDRYMFVLFSMPFTTVKPPEEFVDENHPRILKDFDLMEYINFASPSEGTAIDSAQQIFAYAGV